jgi:hypothetical protein
LALLNSKLSDWYFRLGSTNAHVSHYQLYNLPCPAFVTDVEPSDDTMRERALAALDAGELEMAYDLLSPALANSPFGRAIQAVIVESVRRIIAIEVERGDIARMERSALNPAAQPYQALIDALFFGMAGLTADEVKALEDRYATML